ncbi:MAG: hypothetical protein PHV34_17335 [Verrucomicrobiae bacterium]|nr:hypothetical protein [Verrucomicrobiae bacterium]
MRFVLARDEDLPSGCCFNRLMIILEVAVVVLFVVDLVILVMGFEKAF